MKIKDRVYGDIEIFEPVLLDIIHCSAFQRLKKIDQSGYMEPFSPGTEHSRFEHSIGVCFLLKKFGASTEEQIAGLIHDVSHSAFSHCIDYVLDGGSGKTHNYQDDIFENFVKRSDIPEILKKYNYNIEFVLDDKNFPLKEKELPDLCADRIDYSLRSGIIWGTIKDSNYFLENLTTSDDKKWIFKSFQAAKKYAELFYELNAGWWAGLSAAVMFKTVGDYLKYSLSKNYISEADLYTTDKEVLSKIELFHKKDNQLQQLFDRMNNKIAYKNDSREFESEIFCKSRVVDPFCFYNGEVKRLSEIDPNWVEVLKNESKPKQYFLKFEQ